ncbi:hypothetical protein [Paenibacillus beijingensis]|uniref:Uncharacterized protein n=1 Tax=Paenibacillus beijingensis TaxID=1126833 RepID=A0A0D5NGD9_9BACL|nr:hypothetical protein [Paenibacillus beijingensis]AJY74459.1 hypothetical protein VN24_07575 [Paenibacillus beijingensis]
MKPRAWERIDDYTVEQYLLFERGAGRGAADEAVAAVNAPPGNFLPMDRRTPALRWQHLVQYAVNHAVNDFYALPRTARDAKAVHRLLEARWSNRAYLFGMKQRYVTVKSETANRLSRFLAGGAENDEPILSFERVSTPVPELRKELAMLYHLVFASKEGSPSIVRKFIVDDREELREAIVHMAVAVSMNAFGQLPQRIEICSVMSGRRHVYRTDEGSLARALDYIRLIGTCMAGSYTEGRLNCIAH